MVTVYTDFPGNHVRTIIRKICKADGKTQAYVTDFQRFGKSGAKLFLLYFARRPEGLPYVLKITTKKAAAKEFGALKSLYETVRDCHLRCYRLFKTKKWGGLLYEHQAADAHGEAAIAPVTLREILWRDRYSPRDERLPRVFQRVSTRGLATCIKEALDKLKDAHSGAKNAPVTPSEQYKGYLRKGRSKARLTRILGKQSECKEPLFLGAKIANPLWLIADLPHSVTIKKGYVHGDLHPDNIVVSKALRPHLIDFAWGRADQDILVDYALLECSIRFRDFPKWNLEDQLKVDDCLLECDGYNKVDDLRFSSDAARARYRRLAVMIKVLREAAQGASGAHTTSQKASLHRHYLFVQFILLYGLLAFDDYDSYVTTRALGLIAKRLIEGKWQEELSRW